MSSRIISALKQTTFCINSRTNTKICKFSVRSKPLSISRRVVSTNNMLENRTLNSTHLFGNNNFFKQSNSRWPNNALYSIRIFCPIAPKTLYFVDLFHQTPKMFHKLPYSLNAYTTTITPPLILYIYTIHLYKTHHRFRIGDKLMFLVPISNIYRHPLKYCLCIHTCKEISWAWK